MEFIMHQKNVIRYLVIIVALMGIVFLDLIPPINARADDLDNQIALKETQLQSLQWEFRYLQERITTIQVQAQRLQVEIDALKKQREKNQKEEKK